MTFCWSRLIFDCIALNSEESTVGHGEEVVDSIVVGCSVVGDDVVAGDGVVVVGESVVADGDDVVGDTLLGLAVRDWRQEESAAVVLMREIFRLEICEFMN